MSVRDKTPPGPRLIDALPFLVSMVIECGSGVPLKETPLMPVMESVQVFSFPQSMEKLTSSLKVTLTGLARTFFNIQPKAPIIAYAFVRSTWMVFFMLPLLTALHDFPFAQHDGSSSKSFNPKNVSRKSCPKNSRI